MRVFGFTGKATYSSLTPPPHKRHPTPIPTMSLLEAADQRDAEDEDGYLGAVQNETLEDVRPYHAFDAAQG